MKKEIKKKIKEMFCGYDIHFESGGSDDFIDEISELFEQEKQKLMEKILPGKKEIKKNRTTDEKRYPMGWNACLAEIIRRLKNK